MKCVQPSVRRRPIRIGWVVLLMVPARMTLAAADEQGAMEQWKRSNADVVVYLPKGGETHDGDNEMLLAPTAPKGDELIATKVNALTQTLQSSRASEMVQAADALAAIGPEAKAAIPALIDKLSYEHPWVRTAAMSALAAMGKEAVPALIETFRTQTGGPRTRAASVLGSIGPKAKPAVPILEAAMRQEPPAGREQLAGVLAQIDPERYAATGAKRGAPHKVEGPSGGAEPVPGSTSQDAGWPQFHGPNRDSLCLEHNLLQQWPEGGPRLLWKLEGIGRGYSNVSIANGKIFTMGDRAVGGKVESQSVIALDLRSHKELWSARVGPPHKDGGPRCTPTLDGSFVYALGTEGDLVCLDARTGAEKWRKSLPKDFGGRMMSGWKFSESPLVDGDKVICTPGGKEAAMAALDKRTGDVVWRCVMPVIGNRGGDGAGYSSAIAAEICGVRQYVQLLGRGAIGVEAATGRFLWGYNDIANNIANIPTPIARGDYVFVTTAYNTGAALLKITRDGERFQAQEVYFINPKDFQNHHGGVVLVGDCLYGGSGPSRGDPTCIELSTGKIAWKQRAPSQGSAGILYADRRLIFRYDRGEVFLIEASPKAFQIKGRFTPPRDEGPAWPHPVVHQGKLYLRHSNSLLCYDLRLVDASR